MATSAAARINNHPERPDLLPRVYGPGKPASWNDWALDALDNGYFNSPAGPVGPEVERVYLPPEPRD